MSTERGNVKKKGAPAHQNKTAFHHNKNSRLTKKVPFLAFLNLIVARIADSRASEPGPLRKMPRDYRVEEEIQEV